MCMKILKAPTGIGAMTRADGQELSPDAIVKALENFYLKENGILPVKDIKEIPVVSGNHSETNDAIYQDVKALDSRAILIGGDHSITYPSFKAFSENNLGAGLIVFDAHPDCENDFQPPTHEDYLRVLVAQDNIRPENIIMIGLRNMDAKELSFLREKKIRYYQMRQLHHYTLQDFCDGLTETASRWPALYVSVDIDVLDPAYAPGTGYIEPGGMSSRDLLYMLQRIKNIKSFKMMDLVEVNPKKDVNGMTVAIAAKIVTEMC